jgi:hypothetical protein
MTDIELIIQKYAVTRNTPSFTAYVQQMIAVGFPTLCVSSSAGRLNYLCHSTRQENRRAWNLPCKAESRLGNDFQSGTSFFVSIFMHKTVPDLHIVSLHRIIQRVSEQCPAIESGRSLILRASGMHLGALVDQR